MTTSIAPALIAALVDQAPGVVPDGVEVRDGYGISLNPGDQLLVGVDDPMSQAPASSADSTLDLANMGGNRPQDEAGEITLAALATSGDTDAQRQVRESAYAIVDAVKQLLPDPAFVGAVPGLMWARLSRQQLTQDQDADGTLALIVFRVAYRARIVD